MLIIFRMIAQTLKNCLLAFLIIFMIHFMIQNTIIDEIEKLHRFKIHKSLHIPIDDDEIVENKVVKPNKVYQPRRIITEEIKSDEIKSDDCSNSLSCDDFKEETKPKTKKEIDDSKELYDFVFEDTEAEMNLNHYFDETVTKDAIEEKDRNIEINDIDIHHNIVTTQNNNTNTIENDCMFEVIGVIETDNDSISAFDNSMVTSFFKVN
jgi:hypothetical protein